MSHALPLRLLPALGLLLAAAAPAQAASDPAATVDAYHAALKNRDTQTVVNLLALDAVLYEQGFVEKSRGEYAGPHLTADEDFAASTTYAVTDRKILWFGDNAATVVTQNRTTGTYQKQRLNLVGTETMVLRKAGDGWVIQHAHWSAHPDKEPPPAPSAPAPAKKPAK